MADENDIEVGIGVVGGELEAQLQRVYGLMTSAARAAETVRNDLLLWGEATRVLPGNVAKITGELEKLAQKRNTPANRAKKSELEAQLEQENAAIQYGNKLLADRQRLLQENAVASGMAKVEAGNTKLADGRTVNEARSSNSALNDAIMGINTTAEQLMARLALATGKAAERMLTSTATAMEQSQALVANRLAQQDARLRVPGALDARVVNAAVSEERSVALAQRGGSLAERQAGTRIYSDASYENTQRTLAANRIRRDAEREDAERDRIAAQVRTGLMSDAGYEDIQRSRARARLQTQAEWENRQLDRAYTAAQNSMYASATTEDRSRTLRLNPDTASRITAKDESFTKRYGADRGEFETRIRAENLSIQQQVAELKRLREAKLAVDVGARAGGAAPMTDAERAASGFRQRNAAFDLNGGADQLTMQAKLAANYAIFGAITGAITGSVAAIKEFDDTLFRFQAITNTAQSEMGGFRKELLSVAADSRFSVNELAQVAIMLGQTGLSASDVAKALRPVSDLAAASGSTLQQSGEAITGVLGAYGMSATRAGEVSDILTGALNRTKLTMEQLQLGIQYSANIARDSGVSFSELTATIGAISQAGVRSGSTIGTGLRQLITELSSPTDKFKNVLKELGINLTEVDLRANGLSGVLKNLQNAGFTTADALRALDLRAANAFSAIGGQGDLIEKLRQEMLLSSAAAEGAAKANESLSATLQRLQNVTFSLVDTAFSPLVAALKVVVDGLTGMVGSGENLTRILPALGVGLATIVGGLAAIKIGSLVFGLLTSGMAGPIALMAGLAAGVGYLGLSLLSLESPLSKVAARLDILKGVENELSSKRDAVTASATEIDRSIEGIIARREQLNRDPIQLDNEILQAQKAFGDLGFSMEGVSRNADGLVQAYQRLRAELATQLPGISEQQILMQQQKILALREQQKLRAKQAQPDTQYQEIDGVSVSSAVVDPNKKYRDIGPAFGRAMDVVANPTQLGETDALGNAKIISAEMIAAQRTMFADLEAEKIRIGATPESLKLLQDRYDTASKAVELFGKTTGEATAIQAARSAEERAQSTLQIEGLRARPEVAGFENAAEALKSKQISEQTAVLNATGLDARTKLQQMRETLRVVGDEARAQIEVLEQYRQGLVAAGAGMVESDAAVAKAKGKLDEIAKNASNESRDLIDNLKPDAVLEFNREKRGNEAAITTLTRQAQTTNDSTELAAVSEQIRIKTLQNQQITKDLLTLGKTPEQVAADGSLKAQIDALDGETDEKLTKLALDVAARRKRVEDAVLKISSDTDKRREADLRAQADQLEKVAKDVRTTPEKAKELVVEINKLLDEAKEIAARRNNTDIQRDLRDAPSGPIADSVKAPAGSVAEGVINGARGAGRADRMDYLLGLGQLESELSNSATSETDAKGVFQFTGGTWDTYGKGGDIRSTEAQVAAVLKFTEDNADRFSKAMGRAATDAELFVMHNQGGPGGMRLLRNPNSRAADFVAEDAIRVNLPKGMRDQAGTITAGEFTKVLGGYLETGKRQVAGSTTTTAELIRQKGAAELSKVDEVDAKRRRELSQIVPGKEDQALLASLKLLDKADTAKIAEVMGGLSKAVNLETLQAASSSAIGAYGRLNANALKEDGLDSKNASRTPEAKIADQEAITGRFRDLTAKQAETAAAAAGKLATKDMDEELKRAEARYAALDTDANRNKFGGQAELDTLSQQIEKLKEKRGLQGESQSLQAQIDVLQKSITDAETAGLGPSEKQVELNKQLVDLKEKLAKIQPQLKLKADIEAAPSNLDAGIRGGIIDFGKSRGILTSKGGLVDEVEQARRTISGALTTIGGAFDNLWTNLVSGSMTAGAALKKFATDILGGLMSQVSKSLTNDIFKALLGGDSGSSGGFLGSIMSLFGGGGSSVGGTTMANGGYIRMAGGGAVPRGSASNENRDSKRILGMPGEYLLRKSAVDAIGKETLDQVNALGGAMVNRAPKVDPQRTGSSARAESNVYVVGQEQVPPPGPRDIVHHITDDIQRGGAVAKLIKRVAAGG